MGGTEHLNGKKGGGGSEIIPQLLYLVKFDTNKADMANDSHQSNYTQFEQNGFISFIIRSHVKLQCIVCLLQINQMYNSMSGSKK